MKESGAIAATGVVSLALGVWLKYGAANGLIVFGVIQLLIGLGVAFLNYLDGDKR